MMAVFRVAGRIISDLTMKIDDGSRMISLMAVVPMGQKLAALAAVVPCGEENNLR